MPADVPATVWRIADRLAELHPEFTRLARQDAARRGGLAPACPGNHIRRPVGPLGILLGIEEG